MNPELESVKSQAKDIITAQRIARYALRRMSKGDTDIPAKPGRFRELGSSHEHSERVYEHLAQELGRFGVEVTVRNEYLGAGDSVDRLSLNG